MLSSLFKQFFSYHYMFAEPIQLPSKFDRGIYYAGLTLIVVAIVLFAIRRMQNSQLTRNLLIRYFRLSFYTGLLLAIWFWLRYELIKVVSVHFVAVLIVLGALAWLVRLLVFQFGQYKQMQDDFDREQLKKRYM